MHPDTVRLANAFFVENALLQRADAGGYIPHVEVVHFNRAFEFGQSNPEYKLQPVLKESWFSQALSTKLAFRGSLEEVEALTVLAESANATPEHRAQLIVAL